MPFDGTKLDDVTKLLIEGRERIERGWCQGVMRKLGAVCMVGALYEGTIGSDGNIYFNAELRLQRGAGTDDLPRWNDAPERTKDEVLQAFDRAIANG